MTTPTPVLAPVYFDAPLLNPTAFGLYASTTWTEIGEGEPSRHLTGVEVRPAGNYGGDQASGNWGGAWCGEPTPGQKKEGGRPAGLDPFEPLTVWAYDECDLTAPSRAEVQARAMQIMRLEEQVMVEREVAERLKLDAADLGPVEQAAGFKAAVGYLEGAMALTNTLGFFHAGAQWASQELGLVVKSGTRWTSPLGHTWIFGGGYVEGLENTIVATSHPFGWRDQVRLRTAIDERHNIFAAVAERTVLVGYEALIAAVEIAP
ncbi:hypothetical protein [Mycobacterium persicum]|uniref:hypothetical protein n=1 Tax=Mycobacterium persicum TaxID=1487726 RepID=UPI000C06C309|nr:hypothetical protein [Mycobacterium persicum]